MLESALMKTCVVAEVVSDGRDDYHQRIEDPTTPVDDRTIPVGPLGRRRAAEVVSTHPPGRPLRDLPRDGDRIRRRIDILLPEQEFRRRREELDAQGGYGLPESQTPWQEMDGAAGSCLAVSAAGARNYRQPGSLASIRSCGVRRGLHHGAAPCGQDERTEGIRFHLVRRVYRRCSGPSPRIPGVSRCRTAQDDRLGKNNNSWPLFDFRCVHSHLGLLRPNRAQR
ncbi:hypothetical protein VTN02DRAFT_108 [Thermoascus thermophilus]